MSIRADPEALNGEVLEQLKKQTELLENQVELQRKSQESRRRRRRRRVVVVAQAQESLQYLSHKANCYETRQCQLAGEANDASRMTSMYVRGSSALWSKHTKLTILESLFKKGGLDSILNERMFAMMDARRSELCAAVFYQTYVALDGELYDAFSTASSCCDKLFRLLPSFRDELLNEAKQQDILIENKTKEPLEGTTCEEAVKSAIGEIPPGLRAIYESIVPVNRQWEPVRKRYSSLQEINQAADTFENASNALPVRAKEFFKMAQDLGFTTRESARENLTEAIVKWCWEMSKTAKKQYELTERDHSKRAEMLEHIDKKQKTDKDNVLFERLIKNQFPKYAKMIVCQT